MPPLFEVPYLIFVAGESLFHYPPALNIKNEFAFCYHVYNLENMKINHGQVLLLIKLLASAWFKGHMKYSVCLSVCQLVRFFDCLFLRKLLPDLREEIF